MSDPAVDKLIKDAMELKAAPPLTDDFAAQARAIQTLDENGRETAKRLERLAYEIGQLALQGKEVNNLSMADSISRPELDAKFDAIRSEMRADAAALRVEMSSLRGDLNAGMQALRADFHETGTASARWLLATAVGMIVGFGGLFLTMSNSLKQPSPAQPTVVVLPASVAAALPASSPSAK